MTARREFPIAVRRAAVARAAKRCEAVGADYGLAPGARCDGDISAGFDYDHIIADSIGGEPTLENCAVVCKACHGFKTARIDTPRAAKTKRQRDLRDGVRPASRMAHSRNSRTKQKLDGRVVDRQTGEEIRR